MRYEESVQLSKLQFTHDRSYFFAGKIEKDMPGSIQVLQFANPKEPAKVFEIQAHAKSVERLRLSYDNTTLFSCGLDGSVACFAVIYKDKKKADQALPPVGISTENLLLKTELDKKKAKIDSLRQNIAQENKNKMFEHEQQVLRKKKQIEDQKATMEAKAKENQDRLSILEQATKDSIEGYHKMLEQMRIKHADALERLIADQKEKVDADH